MQVERALISVFDKTGLDVFARGLADLGVEIVASGGTAAYIAELGIDVVPVEELTDVPELLGGRVKTLHPHIHAGILARRGLEADLDQLREHDIRTFDPRETIIRTPALGRSVAMALGDKPGVLLRGHGVALTDRSLRALVVRAYNMRMNARMQQQAIALGGKVTYLEDPPAPPATPPAGDAGYNRGWEYWKQIVSVD